MTLLHPRIPANSTTSPLCTNLDLPKLIFNAKTAKKYISKPKYDLSSLHKKKTRNHERLNSITQNKALDNILFKVSVSNNKKKWRKRIPLSQPPQKFQRNHLYHLPKPKIELLKNKTKSSFVSPPNPHHEHIIIEWQLRHWFPNFPYYDKF